MLIYIGNTSILSDVFAAIQYFSVRTVTVATVKVNYHRLLLLLDPLIDEWTWERELGGSANSSVSLNMR